MPYSVNIKYQRQFFTTDECKTSITDEHDADCSITFVTDYKSRHFYNDLDLVFRLVNEELEELKCTGLYKNSNKIDFDDIEIDVIYVADGIEKSIQEDDVRQYKMKRFTVPICRRKRKYRNTKSSRNVLADDDEPVNKKAKIE